MTSPPLDEDAREILHDMYRACADDLRRWARAFATEPVGRDAEISEALEKLADACARKAE